ncbi:MAG: hypothetical protein HUU10_04135 [Bacteroidetes bacterium]|nr:hypothetical protein [Bacteroidota bacterium]
MTGNVIVQKRAGRLYFQFRLKGNTIRQITSGVTLSSSTQKRVLAETEQALNARLRQGLQMLESGKISPVELDEFLRRSGESIGLTKPAPVYVAKNGWLALTSEWFRFYSGNPGNLKHSVASIKEAQTAIRYFNEFWVDYAIAGKWFSELDRHNEPAVITLLGFPVEQISHKVLQAFIDWMSLKKTAGGTPFRRRTIEINVNKIRTFWRWGMANVTRLSHGFDWPSHYPFFQLKYPRIIVEREAVKRLERHQNSKSFYPEELAILMDYMRVHRARPFIDCCMLAVFTGASLIDVCKMPRSAVNLQTRKLTYFRQKLVRSDGVPKLVEIPLDDYLVGFFSDLLSRYSGNSLIHQPDGKPINKHSLSHAVSESVRVVLPGRALAFGSFRHTFITMSLAAGIPVDQVAKMVGNSPEIVFKNYDHNQVSGPNMTTIRTEMLSRLSF